jgi:hypothetical protein
MARALDPAAVRPIVGTRAVVRGERLIWRVAPLAIVILAAALRMTGLTAIGFNSDEAVYSGQAASIAGDDALTPFFPIFRAHPLLVQTFLSLPFAVEVSDTAARLTAAVIGLAAVLAVYGAGASLFGGRVGMLGALFMAAMPYHVIVSRQFLLDGPLTLLTTLALFCLARFGSTNRYPWLYAAGAVLGLAFLSKETGIVFLGATYAFLALTPEVVVRLRHLAVAMLTMAAVIACFPVSLALAGGGGASTAQQYFVWQLLRRPNHDLLFYPTVVPPAVGPLLVMAALVSVWVFRSRGDWRMRLLLSWALVPIAFFALWPTKGFQYLLPSAPVIAILAARLLLEWRPRPPAWLDRIGRAVRRPRAIAIAVMAGSLIVPSTAMLVAPAPSGGVLAGGGGVPGGREAGWWIDANLPSTARLMTIGPSMGNILQFYGHRPARAMSVSPDPLKRNPSYEPIRNPDYSVRTGEFQYLVWDAYSATRTRHFSERLLDLVRRYDGRLVHAETVSSGAPGASIRTPVIQVYEVRPTAEPSTPVPPAAERPAARREYIYGAYGIAAGIALVMILIAALGGRRRRTR